MHRSGTSCLTGSLEDAGLTLGEIHTWNKHNRKGNRENQSFVDLHDAILAENGGAWDMPPPTRNWSPAHIEQAQALLAEQVATPVFGFKDPRAVLLLEGWKQIYPSIEFAGIFRHPNAVAASLDKRSFKPRLESIALWYSYNSIVYEEYQRKPFPIIDFDVEEAVLDEKIAHVVKELGLPGSDSDEKFFTPTLKNNSETGGAALPWKAKRLLKKLKRISL